LESLEKTLEGRSEHTLLIEGAYVTCLEDLSSLFEVMNGLRYNYDLG